MATPARRIRSPGRHARETVSAAAATFLKNSAPEIAENAKRAFRMPREGAENAHSEKSPSRGHGDIPGEVGKSPEWRELGILLPVAPCNSRNSEFTVRGSGDRKLPSDLGSGPGG